MTIAADYQLQDVLYKAYGSTAQSSDCAFALEISKYNNLREAHLIDINE
jgi:hypothetical protein